MSDTTYQVIVNGQLVDGADPEQTKQNIAKLFKTTPDKVAPMFAGKPVAVKKNLDETTAKKYQLAIIKSGLKAGVAPMKQAQPAATAAAIDADLAAVGATMDDTPPPPDADIDTSAYNMGEVGETIVEAEVIPEPQIDISAMSMDQVGVTMDDTPPPAEPDINIDNYSMGEAGEDVMEHEPVPDADIDISELSMGDVGEDVTEHAPVPPADIDTSALKLDN